MSDQEGLLQSAELSSVSEQDEDAPDDGRIPIGASITNSVLVNADNLSDRTTDSALEFISIRVYSSRWIVLFVLSWIGCSNGMIWITFAPIADKTNKVFHITDDQVNWLSLVFPVISIPVGLLSVSIIDIFSLRFILVSMSWINAMGCVLRYLSIVAFPSSPNFVMLIIGQSLSACGQTFLMSSSTKVASQWFPETQRTIANTIASMANPLGILTANIISPWFVANSETSALQFHMEELLLVYVGIAVFGGLAATLTICHSEPPTPPSHSVMQVEEMKLLPQLLKMLQSKDYVILMISFGIGVGLFTALSTLLQQLLSPRGYSDDFAGLCGALLVGIGVVGALLVGLYVDYSKKLEEVAKCCLCFATLSAIGLSIASSYENFEPVIAFCVALFGFFGLPLYAVCLELSVECTHPIPVGKSSVLLVVFGQVQSIVVILVMQWLSGNNGTNFVYSLLFFNIYASVSAFLFVLLFKSPYKRLQYEQSLAAQQILSRPRILQTLA